MQEHPQQFRNFRVIVDVVIILREIRLKQLYFLHLPCKDNWGDKLEYHNLSQWRFDENGQLVDLDGKRVTNLKVTALAEATAGMYHQKLKATSADICQVGRDMLDQLAGNGLGKEWLMWLDGADDVKHLQEEVVSAQELWNQLDFVPDTRVMMSSIDSASAGDSVGSVKQDFERMNQKVGKLATEFGYP